MLRANFVPFVFNFLMAIESIVTRFAPSPTGPLHLGHAYAVLVAHDLARARGGRFLVRIEDLDGTRSRPEFEAGIFEDLAWLGLFSGGSPLRQSERMNVYAEALARLEAMGLLYPCFCTRKEIAAEIARAGEAPQGDAQPVYPGTCRRLSHAERAGKRASGRDYALRLDVAAALARTGPLDFVELWALGAPQRVRATPERAGDVVLARKELSASYHLAVVVDDAASGITVVTRGDDLLPAAHIQVLLQALLGLAHPIYAHHPLVRDDDGKRLAKRDSARSLAGLRAQGRSADDIRRALPPLPDLSSLKRFTSC